MNWGENNEFEYLGKEKWPTIGLNLSEKIERHRIVFFNESLKQVKLNELPLTNTKKIFKTEIALIATQLLSILQIIPRYIKPEDGQEFVNFFTIQLCKSQQIYESVYNYLIFLNSFNVFGEDDYKQRTWAITLDIVKCICGLSIDKMPTTLNDFDDLYDYLFEDVPGTLQGIFQIVSFKIIPLEYNFRALTTIDTAEIFGDKNLAKKLLEDLQDYNGSMFKND